MMVVLRYRSLWVPLGVFFLSLSIASLGGFLLFSKYLHSSIPFGVIHTYRCFHESTHGNCLKHKTKEAVIMCQGYTQRVKGLNDTKVSIGSLTCDWNRM